MPTVLRQGGLRVVIYTDDHPPPHVHVFGDGETKIALAGGGGAPEVIRAIGASLTGSRRALRIVRNSRNDLLERWTTFMDDLNHEEFKKARRCGDLDLQTKPRAKSVRYDQAHDRIVIELASGATFSFPPRLAQGLETATPEQLAEVEILGAGFGLHWERLDADLTVEGLLAGRFGSARYMAERYGRGWASEAAE